VKRICFVSLKSYDLLSDNPQPRFIGGAERQQVLVARGLQQLGYQVSFVTLDFGQPDGIEHSGIRVFKAYDPDAGLPVVRAITPRWTGLASALRRADADIYHQMCADSETGQIALWCRRHGRRFVFAVASDADCTPDLPLLETRRQRWLYRYGLKRADHVVSQTLSQQFALRKNFAIDSTLVPSCSADGASSRVNDRFPKSERPTLVWVSRLVPLKRLEWLLDLAEKSPAYRFIVVGGGEESDPYVQGLISRARGIPNVEMLGRVPDSQLWDVYERADLLLDTAAVAGVPTTFLEAWARGVPVVSTVNPDNIVSDNNLGRVVNTIEEMAQAVSQLLGNSAAWSECSRAARLYFERNHTVEAIGAAYHQLFGKLANAPATAANAMLGNPQPNVLR
jgi:glycosyltransferase involved in cell wall biosynthesis